MSRYFFRLIAAVSFLSLSFPAIAQQMNFGESQQAPPPPTGVGVMQHKSDPVEVSWNNVSAPAVNEFHLFRLENYSPDTTLKTLAVIPRYSNSGKTFKYVDSTALSNRTYTYFLTSKDRFGIQSSNSKMVTVSTHTIGAAPSR